MQSLRPKRNDPLSDFFLCQTIAITVGSRNVLEIQLGDHWFCGHILCLSHHTVHFLLQRRLQPLYFINSAKIHDHDVILHA